MGYRVMMRYKGGSIEVYDKGLSFREAMETIQALKDEDEAFAKAGCPVQVVEYWKEKEG